MKKTLLAAFFAASAMIASAQSNIHQGNWMVGGDASLKYYKNGDYRNTLVSVAPNVGYFFIDNFAGGLRLDLSSNTEKYSGTTTDKSTSFNYEVAPFVRYYFLPSTQKVNIFADGQFGFGELKTKINNNAQVKNNFNEFTIAAGPAFFLTPSTALEMTLGWNSIKYKGNDDRQGTLALSVGFQIHLPGHGRK